VTLIEGRLDTMDPLALEARVLEADVAVSCRLNFEERDALNRACVATGRPMVEAAMYGMEYTLTTILPGRTPCLRCIHPAFPAWDALGFPVLGAVPGVVGSLAAAEAVKLVTGAGRPLEGRLAYGDLGTMTFREFNLRRRTDCPVCAAAPDRRTTP
jgi:molybdopterin/thiamine biosynthesis adenylyltransferase